MIEHESTQVAGLPGDESYTGSGLHGQRMPDAAGRLDTIAWSLANQTVSSTDYELDVMGRRSKATRDDGTHWDYGYNTKGEVTSAVQKAGDDSALSGRDFGYNYDGMGNRTSATVANVYPPPPLSETNYTANNLNQYTGIEHPSPLRKVLQGLAHENAAIEVRSYNSPAEAPAFNATSAALAARPVSLPVARIAPNGQGFITEAPAANNSGPTWRYLTIDAARPGVGMNGRTVKTQRTGWLYYPPANETLVYDLDGNLTEDARWTYTWDAENRLTQMTEKDDGSAAAGTRPALQRLSFTYDSQSRRIRKVAELRRNSNWEVTSDTRFLYDDWNLVGEFVMNQGTLNLKSSYAWGLDLSGTQQGAGGVGGLLLVKLYRPTVAPSTVAPTYDGNGNITAYVELANGSVTQRLEYDAFGNELSLDSTLASSTQTASTMPAFGFSSKYTDHESGLCYYGYRYYSPELGRWTARDPIGEKGGVNLYCTALNTPGNLWDLLGKTPNGDDLLAAALKAFFDNCDKHWENPDLGNFVCSCTCGVFANGAGCIPQSLKMLNNLNKDGPDSYIYSGGHSGPFTPSNFSLLSHNWVEANPTSGCDPGANIDAWKGHIDIEEANGTVAHYTMTCSPKSVSVTYSYNMGPPIPQPPSTDFNPAALY